MDDVTARILSEAQRLSRGAAGDVPVAFSPLRGRTLSSSPSASTDKSLSDLLEEAAYGLSSQVRTGVTRLRGGDVTAVEEEMRADPSAGSYAATYRDLGVPGFLANVLGFGTEILEPGPGEFAALGKALPALAATLPPTVFSPSNVRNLFQGGVEQSIESADTSLAQVPGLFTWMKRNQTGIPQGGVNLDIGGGRFDLASDFVREELNAENLVFDPFNRTSEHNQRVIDAVVERGGADTVTVANVLNVIPEQENQLRVVEQALQGLRPGGQAFFSVYTGDGSGVGRATSKGFQQNLPTPEYMPLIESIFGPENVTRRGNVIIATRPAGR